MGSWIRKAVPRSNRSVLSGHIQPDLCSAPVCGNTPTFVPSFERVKNVLPSIRTVMRGCS